MKPIRVLIVEDSEDDAELLLRVLQKGGYAPQFERVDTEKAFVSALETKEWDVILCDYSMPGFRGTKALSIVRERGLDVPFVFVSGTMGEETAVEAMRNGAHDYLMKGNLKRLIPAIERELRETEERRGRKRAEEALQTSEKRFRSLIEYSSDIIALLNPDGKFRYTSPSITRVLGYDAKELHGQNAFKLVHREDLDRLKTEFNKVISNPEYIAMLEMRFRHKNGSWRWLEGTGSNMLAEHSVQALVGNFRDITERKQTEEQIRFQALLLDQVRSAAIATDLDGNITYWNKFAETLYGWKTEEVLGKNEAGILVPERRIDEIHKVRRLVDEEGFWEGEMDFHRKDGLTVRVQVFSTILRDRSGKSSGRIGISTDITERKRAEELLREKEERFRLLFENMLDGFAYCKMLYEYEKPHDFIYINVNNAFERLTGLKDVVGRKVTEVIPGIRELNPELFEIYGRVALTGQPERFELFLKPLEIWLSISVYSTEKGYFVAVFDNITERKRAEEAARQSEFWITESQRVARIGSYVVDFKAGYWTSSEILDEIFGIDKNYDRSIEGWGKIVHPEQRRDVMEYFEKDVIAHGAPFVKDYRIVRPNDGQERWVSGHGELVYDEKGNLLKMFGTIQDITERKRVEEALKKSEGEYRNLFENANDAILIFEPETENILEANNRACELYGFRKEEFTGMSLKKLTKDVARGEIQIQQTLQDLSYKNFETQHFKKDGRSIDLLVNASVIEYGGKTAILSINRDVTMQRELERQFMQAQKMESIGTLAGGIAHDFNNILGIILGYSTLIQREQPSSELVAQAVKVINDAVTRGAALVRQILTFARKTEVIYGLIDVHTMIKETAKMLSETFAKTIVCKLELGKDVQPIVADASQVHQTILNLCVNARDAMPKGGTLTIKTRMVSRSEMATSFPDASEEHYLCLSISDTGVGMDEAVRNRIFEPFFTTKAEGKGTGLGLAVVYGVVKSHRGFLSVESVPGKGSTFFLYFPVPPGAQKKTSVGDEPGEEIPSGDETVLVVEDEALLLGLISSVVRSKGYNVMVATNGEEAVEVYRQNKETIDLVLSDFGLPKMSGKQVYSRIKEINPRVKFIIASGYLEPEDKSEMFKGGVKNFVQKPYKSNEVLKLIRETIDAKV